MSSQKNRNRWIVAGALGCMALCTLTAGGGLLVANLGNGFLPFFTSPLPMPQPAVAISLKNIGQVTQLYRLPQTVSVWSLAWSPDGRLLASGGGQDVMPGQGSASPQMLKLWDVATGGELRSFLGHTNTVSSVAFSPDGQRLASASRDGTVKLWDVATGGELRSFLGHTDWVFSVAFSPDGQRLASASYDGTVKLWEVSSGRELRTLDGYSGIAFLPDEKMLAWAWTLNVPYRVKLSDVQTGRELWTLNEKPAAFSHDGKIVAVRKGLVPATTFTLWDMTNGQVLRELGIVSAGSCIAFSPDDTLVVAAAGTSGERSFD